MIRVTTLALCLAAPAQASELAYSFFWQGEGGYALSGALSYDATFGTDGLVRGDELTCFVTEGLKDGVPIGRWALGDLNEDTSWKLTFDPSRPAFVVEGEGIDMPQAWNMDGFGTDCGAGGFGFNIGDAAQDICLDGTLIVESQVDPYRPFPVSPAPGFVFPRDACRGPDLLSLLAD